MRGRLTRPTRSLILILISVLLAEPAEAAQLRSAAQNEPPARVRIRFDRNGRPEPSIARTPLRSALVGRWEGEDYTLTIDQDAVQANRDPTKPFQWDALHILDAKDTMIVFDLGGDRFVALLSENGMTLTQAGLPGYRYLVRKR